MQLKEVKIGEIVKIYGNKIIFEVCDNFKNKSTIWKNNFYHIGGIGSFVKVISIDKDLILKIESEEAEPIISNTSSIITKPKYKHLIKTSLVGYIDKIQKKFISGISEMPQIFSNVFFLSTSENDKLFQIPETTVSELIGYQPLNDNRPYRVDLNKLFSSHIGIFGTTGSGKSFTIAKIIEIFLINYEKLKNNHFSSSFYIFDVNGEYSNLVNDDNSKNLVLSLDSKNSFKIPIDKMSPDDWAILLNASDKTHKPYLILVCDNFKKITDKNSLIALLESLFLEFFDSFLLSNKTGPDKLNYIHSFLNLIIDIKKIETDEALCKLIENIFNLFKSKITNDLIVHFGLIASNKTQKSDIGEIKKDFDTKIDSFKEEIQKEKSKNSETINCKTFTIFTLIFWIINHIHKLKYSNLYSYYESFFSRFDKRWNIINKIIGTSSEALYKDEIFNNKISIFDISNLPEWLKVNVSGILINTIYKEHKISKNFNKKRIFFVLDEAHHYFTNSKNEEYTERTEEMIEEISKEGRKFESFLIVGSQRPSEISKTVLSQINNIFIHKIINEVDLNALQHYLSFIDKNSILQLSVLSQGEAIVSGIFTKIISIVKIEKPHMQPNIQNKDIF